MRISCEEATTLCTKSQYEKLSIVERLKLNYHLFMCRVCPTFSKQNHILTKSIQIHLKDLHKIPSVLSDVEKEEIVQNLKEKYVQEIEASKI